MLGEDLVLVQGQQDRMARGGDVWRNPVSYDKLGVRYRRWRNSGARRGGGERGSAGRAAGERRGALERAAVACLLVHVVWQVKCCADSLFPALCSLLQWRLATPRRGARRRAA